MRQCLQPQAIARAGCVWSCTFIPLHGAPGLGSGRAAALGQLAVALCIFPFSLSYPRPASPAATHELPCRPSGVSPSPSSHSAPDEKDKGKGCLLLLL